MWRNVLNRLSAGSTQLSPITASDYLHQARLHRQNNNGEAAQQAYDTAINLAETEIQNGAFNQAKEVELINLYLEYANFLKECRQSRDKVKSLCDAAIQKAEAKQQRHIDD